MKNAGFKLWFFLSLFAVALCVAGNLCCSNQLAGGSEIGHSRVMGSLYEPCGRKIAVNADVRLRPASVVADTSGLSGVDAGTGKTDANGLYFFNNIDTGLYVVEGFDSADNRVLIQGVHLAAIDSLKVLGPDTLKPAGAIRGKIILSEGGDPRKVLVFCFGIDRFARVNLDGTFLFPDFARGTYTLRVLPLLAEYGVLDTSNIGVRSSDTTVLDSIVLPFTGIPTPKNVTVSYDTLRQIVTLRWSRADTNLVKGYNVYRRDIDSSFGQNPLNGLALIRYPAYTDTTVMQDHVYEYKVVAIDTGDNPGKMSAGATASVVSAFKLLKTFGGAGTAPGKFSEIRDIRLLKNHNLIALDYVGNRAEVFDTSGAYLFGWGSEGQDDGQFEDPESVTQDDSGFIYIVEMTGAGRVQKFDSMGQYVTSWTVGTYCKGVVYSEGRLFLASGNVPGMISIDLQTNGMTIKQMIGTAPAKIAIDAFSRLYVTDDSVKQIFIIDTTLSVLKTFQCGFQMSCPYGIALGPKGRIFITDPDQGRIIVLDSSGEFITKLVMSPILPGTTEAIEELRPHGLWFDEEGNLWVADKYFIRKYFIDLP
jgi:hypothetical protein